MIRSINENISGHSSLWIVDTTMIKFQISKQIIVTGGLVITSCRVVLVNEDTVMNSRLVNSRHKTGLQCQIWERVREACSQPFAHQGHHATSQQS